MIQAYATSRYVRTSAQKAGLVLELIRGKDVNRALATLRFTKKSVATDVAKVLRSAIANAQQKEGFSGDVDRLFVSACFANQGPSQKRVRPAPVVSAGAAESKKGRRPAAGDRPATGSRKSAGGGRPAKAKKA
jgi:large subunit ribosomal protein L22